jgi:uncharacterized membrane protein YfcA
MKPAAEQTLGPPGGWNRAATLRLPTSRALLNLALIALIPVAIVATGRLALGLDIATNAAVAGFLVGSLLGLTGMGSGALMTPILILIVGVPPVTAVGTDLAYSSITKLVGGYQHLRLGNVDTRLVRRFAAGSVPASLASVQLLEYLRRHYDIATVNAALQRGLGVVLLLSALGIAISALRARDAASRARPSRAFGGWQATILGAVVGFLVGLTSVGSGSLVVALLSLVTPLSAATIVGTDVAHAALLTSAAALAHGLAGNVDPSLLASLLAGSLPGVLLGGRLTGRLPASALRVVLLLVLVATGVKLI